MKLQSGIYHYKGRTVHMERAEGEKLSFHVYTDDGELDFVCESLPLARSRAMRQIDQKFTSLPEGRTKFEYKGFAICVIADEDAYRYEVEEKGGGVSFETPDDVRYELEHKAIVSAMELIDSYLSGARLNA